MKESKEKTATFEQKLAHARLGRQNLLLVKWLLLAITVTLLLVYLLTPLHDIIFAA